MEPHYIGVDLHNPFFQACAVTVTGERVWEGRFARRSEGLERFVARGAAPTHIAVEAIGPHLGVCRCRAAERRDHLCGRSAQNAVAGWLCRQDGSLGCPTVSGCAAPREPRQRRCAAAGDPGAARRVSGTPSTRAHPQPPRANNSCAVVAVRCGGCPCQPAVLSAELRVAAPGGATT
jgi:hypothetical protein